MRCSEEEKPDVQRGSRSQIRDTRDASRGFHTVGTTARILEQTGPQQELQHNFSLFFFAIYFLNDIYLCRILVVAVVFSPPQ